MSGAQNTALHLDDRRVLARRVGVAGILALIALFVALWLLQDDSKTSENQNRSLREMVS